MKRYRTFNMTRARYYLPAFAALVLAGCSHFATVSERKPQFQPVRSSIGALVSIEQGIARAAKVENHQPLDAMADLLGAAETAERELMRNPSDEAARRSYNFAVSRVLGLIKQANFDPWSWPLRVPAAGGDYLLTHKPDARPQWNPALYEFTPSDQFDIGGSYVFERVGKEGVGAPVVAVGREMNGNAVRDFTSQRLFYGVTALIHFKGRTAVIEFADPLSTERVDLNGHNFPLAADYTTPLAVMLATQNPAKLGVARLLRPGKYAETARIARLQPYDPDKAVVLVVHGLMDSPATWTPMINHLRADEKIRRSCQFWFYSYPSGYPYPYSASILRRDLDAIEKRYPLRRKMIVIGHSMGGCISRLLITDTGDKLWMEVFKKPPGEVKLSPSSRKLLTESLIFKHRPEVGRVIFISSPLRGSYLASNWVGRVGSMLIKSPVTLLKVGAESLESTTFNADELKLKRIPNSVDTLAPNNRFVKAINTIPITPGIPYNVICGDRGKGGNKDHTKPQMTDGVVPYWSSHMEGAQSELIVPSDHCAHRNPQAIDEVERILKQYAQ